MNSDQYDIIRAHDIDTLIQKTNLFLSRGWQPLGGPMCSPAHAQEALQHREFNEPQYAQAVIRTTEQAIAPEDPVETHFTNKKNFDSVRLETTLIRLMQNICTDIEDLLTNNLPLARFNLSKLETLSTLANRLYPLTSTECAYNAKRLYSRAKQAINTATEKQLEKTSET